MLIQDYLCPTYASVEDIEETLDLPDPNDDSGTYRFTDISHPNINRVKKLIMSAEDEIDRRTRRSWRVNFVKDYITDISEYQWDADARRGAYYVMSGNVIQLKKDILPWNPDPQYIFARCENGKLKLQDAKDSQGEPVYTQEWSGDVVFDRNGDPELMCVDTFNKDGTQRADKLRIYVVKKSGEPMYVALPDGKRTIKLEIPKAPVPLKKIYDGDKLEIRSHMNTWVDVSYCKDGNDSRFNYTGPGGFWFDAHAGRLFVRVRYFNPRYNALRISYRYGSEDPVPAAINRLCSLIVASQIVTMGIFDIKVGSGGDIAGTKNLILQQWDAEIGRIYSEYQRSGSVHSFLR